MLTAFAVIVATLVLFALEPVPIDITAIGVMVALMILGTERSVNLTGITPQQGISGFASWATVTVVTTVGIVRRPRRSETLSHALAELLCAGPWVSMVYFGPWVPVTPVRIRAVPLLACRERT